MFLEGSSNPCTCFGNALHGLTDGLCLVHLQIVQRFVDLRVALLIGLLNLVFAVLRTSSYLRRCVVYLLIPTSNHNVMALFHTLARLYIF